MSFNSAANLAALQHLIEVVAKLRSPDDGCPWDLEQTPESLIPYVIEEAYEVVDAIQSGDRQAIAEELGDLLMQVVLQSQIASEGNHFSIAEVAEGIAQKLIRRHPHVFGEVKAENMEEIHQNWERIKAEEKGEDLAETQKLSYKLKRYARSLPPLMAGMKISQKAAAQGFEWEDADGVWAKFHEELDELRHALEHEPKENQQAELGDLLFTLINVARWYDLDPSKALQSTNRKFIQRLETIETLSDRPISSFTTEELDQLWKMAKEKLAK
ncbi:nucleoside triphosphate pyrophosphohydrolase [Pseudanabaena sp. FACHB-1998]|uniref:nucleoside triphosphate pyrophosphohydrolase n=1 Tax=Pseudanabaena sp. FACHB-1998 TaxID=2692858 RepID=UPI0016819048|nr:nucleoside triphosphate pyrophosphohydrolase [Pseudanabaena sp. FACHB-1998]MBD2179014.1 nucleoside triphosphate pyrophosphohydrolase [Pseudanabaena sp. FACHB-1998]